MSAPTELPADPKPIKKLEKDISKDGKAEEKTMQSTFKDMYKQEKSAAKASKAVEKAEKAVKKLEKHETETVSSLRAATHKHDIAVTNLHSGQADLYAKQQQADKLKQDLANARQRADQVSKDKQVHDVA
ncbi:hypothetical protein K503DRAFT_233383 [Rhizopogon vinicolor AM-OR11-026]|uniref:Uncharacterized protein n=1 Tax=Rhizopogon vinicolor AM-OR11-026 TaxID=1314800 RepID=A0A1B7NDW1_9AGAM|nr:hypothetical protein K503DRAFT_233383 [Rhizopogon vinicolor AM-OR11-026]